MHDSEMENITGLQQQVDEAPEEKKSAATTLVEMAHDSYQFGVSSVGETYAIPKSGPKVVSLLRGSRTSLRNELARAYFRKHSKAPAQQALADALLVVEGFAQEADEQELYLRAFRRERELWLDLGDSSGRAIRVTGDGWSIEGKAPVLSKRTVLNGPLPEPARGSLDDL